LKPVPLALKWKYMTADVEVLQPGLFSCIQDRGRYGFRQYGVPVSGAMDSYAAGMANMLLKNSIDAAVLEITQAGPKMLFSEATVISITGAELSPMLNGRAVENYHVLQVNAGDLLAFGKRNLGSRSYLAVQGGFLTEKILDSRSWYEGLTSCFRLEKGMLLQYEVSLDRIRQSRAAVKPNDYLVSHTVDSMPGPEYELLRTVEKDRLQKMIFQVGKNNNRMGIQLAGSFNNSLQPILTGPVVPGTVQLTPSGTLIILMKDSQTTGGYPRVLQLTERGINTVAQKVVGEELQFKIK
jgi:antagonist of KipI